MNDRVGPACGCREASRTAVIYLGSRYSYGDLRTAAERFAGALYALEHQLAEAHWPKEDNRDPTKIYNPHSPQEHPGPAPPGWQRPTAQGS